MSLVSEVILTKGAENMELLDAIYNRRTVRKFNSKTISEETLKEILEAGTWAPSHGNNQPWEFLLIGPETRKRLTEAYSSYMEAGPLKNPALPENRKALIRSFAQNFGDASVLLAVTCKPASTPLDKYDFPLSAAAAIQNIFLSAWEKEIAGVWLSYGTNPDAHTILNLQEGSTIAGILALGYADNIPLAQPRLSVGEKLQRLP